jgi:D-beta-D-heptose 7-phosphate kinase/D-beta-D-heptose 1-phosphate adenosyltransferase
VGVALGDQLGGDERVARVAAAADDVLARSGARAAVVTLDRDGSVLLAADAGDAPANGTGTGTGTDTGGTPLPVSGAGAAPRASAAPRGRATRSSPP